MTRLLVTGATGYIGSAVLRQALAAGFQVYALTRTEKAAARLTSLGAMPVVGDLSIPGPWQEEANASEAVIHLAQPETYGARVTKKRAEHFRDQRLQMDAHLFQSLRPETIRRIVYVGGTSYYGDQGTELRTEETKPNPKGWGPYIAPAIEALPGFAQHGLPIIEAFPGWVYGPGSWFAEYQIEPLYTGKHVMGLAGRSRIASPVHLEDCARALLFLLEHGEAGERFFIVDDCPVPGNKTVECSARALGVPQRMRRLPEWLCRIALGPIITESLTCDVRLSNSKIRALGFTFDFPTIEEGIPDVVKRWLAIRQKTSQ